MSIREAHATDHDWWDEFIVTVDGGSFLQSWAWGEFQRELGWQYWRLLAEDGDKIIGVALVIKRPLPWGKSWLYVPGGPLITTPSPSSTEPPLLRKEGKVSSSLFAPYEGEMPNEVRQRGLLEEELLKLANDENAIFIRVDPRLASVEFGKGWKKAKREVQPKETLVLDLHKSEEELLAGMHQKTRYNIRVAEKHGVQVRFSRDEKDLEAFLQLAQAVSTRSPFRYHASEYYQAILKTLGSAGMLDIAVAELDNKPLVVHLLISFGNAVTYVHGASGSEQREVMAPHLLQWASIRRAKEQEKHWYDFYGVGPQWPGITRFKEGFGGERRSYVGAWDYPLSPVWYFLYNLRH